MKRILLIAMVLILTATAVFAGAPNLVKNPGFESGLNGWNNWGGTESGSGFGDSKCVVVAQTTAKWSGLDQRIFLPEGAVPARVTLSGRMKTDNVIKGVEAWEMARFVLNFYDVSGKMLGGYQASATEAQGTTDWTLSEKTYEAPPGTQQIEVQCALGNCVGTAYFDDMSLTAVDASGKTIARGSMTGPADEGEWYEVKEPVAGEAGHWVDWSGLLDAPAGKHGMIKANADGTLSFADGTSAKFIGTNLVASACFPDEKTAEATALRLSKMGCNLVRLHHMDAPWFQGNIFGNGLTTRKLDADSMKKLDYLIYCLKQKGIYIFMDLLVHRDFLPGDGIDNKTPDLGGKQVGLFSRKLIELQKEYARQLLTHVNEYTKVAYKEEPAIIASEFINESSIFMHFGGDLLNSAYSDELKKMWKKSGGKGELARFEEDYSNGYAQMKERGSGGNVEGSIKFLADLEWKYFSEMKDELRKIGVPYLLAGSNWAPTLATLSSDAKLDLVIFNNYWDHPQLWKIGNDWNRVLYAPFDNTSMIRSYDGNSIHGLSYARAWNKPFIVTEWNECFPNENRLEGVPMMAAYAALQGWSGFLQFDFDHSPVGSASLGSFTLSKMPDHLAQWVVAAPMFLRGDVKTATGSVVENITAQQRATLPNHSPFLKQNAWLPYVTRYFKSYDDRKPAGGDTTAFGKYVDPQTKVIVSETGELTLDPIKGILRIDTARVQGVEGALKGGSFDFPTCKVQVENSFASVFLVSADGAPLNTSNRMFLVAVGAVKQTGLKYNESRKQLEEVGGLPLLAQVVKGSIQFKMSDPGIKISVKPMSTGGTPGKALPVQVKSDGTVFFLNAGKTMVFEVTRTKR